MIEKQNKQFPCLSQLSFNHTLGLWLQKFLGTLRVLQSHLGLELQEDAVPRSKFPNNLFAYF